MSLLFGKDNELFGRFKLAILCVLTALIAIYLNMQYPFWAVITVLVLYSDRQMHPVKKAILRIIATIMGAMCAYIICMIFINNKLFILLSIFIITLTTSYFYHRSKYTYAWLLGGATAFLVLLSSWDSTESINSFIIWRTAEVCLGVLIVMLDNILFRSTKIIPETEKIMSKYFIITRCIKAGIAALLTTLILIYTHWYAGAIGVASAFIISLKEDTGSAMQIALERSAGCFFGAAVGLFFLCFITHSILSVLFTIFIMTALYSHAYEQQKIDYAKLQFMVAFLLAIMPANNILTLDIYPALERLFGILLGVSISLLVVNFIWPKTHAGFSA